MFAFGLDCASSGNEKQMLFGLSLKPLHCNLLISDILIVTGTGLALILYCISGEKIC